MFSTPLIALFDELLNIQKPHNSNGIVSFRWALPFIERTDNARGFNRMKFGNNDRGAYAHRRLVLQRICDSFNIFVIMTAKIEHCCVM